MNREEAKKLKEDRLKDESNKALQFGASIIRGETPDTEEVPYGRCKCCGHISI